MERHSIVQHNHCTIHQFCIGVFRRVMHRRLFRCAEIEERVVVQTQQFSWIFTLEITEWCQWIKREQSVNAPLIFRGGFQGLKYLLENWCFTCLYPIMTFLLQFRWFSSSLIFISLQDFSSLSLLLSLRLLSNLLSKSVPKVLATLLILQLCFPVIFS